MGQALQLHGSAVGEIRAGSALQQVAEQGRAGARQGRGEAGPALLCLAVQGLRHPRLRRRRAWTVQDSQARHQSSMWQHLCGHSLSANDCCNVATCITITTFLQGCRNFEHSLSERS